MVDFQEAKIPRKLAPTIGIAVDPRRVNLSTEALAANVERLQAYRKRLILFPRKSGQQKKGDAEKSEVEKATKGEGVVRKLHEKGILAVAKRPEGFSETKKSEMGKGTEAAYRVLRDARSEARLVGVRERRAKAKADEAAASKK